MFNNSDNMHKLRIRIDDILAYFNIYKFVDTSMIAAWQLLSHTLLIICFDASVFSMLSSQLKTNT